MAWVWIGRLNLVCFTPKIALRDLYDKKRYLSTKAFLLFDVSAKHGYRSYHFSFLDKKFPLETAKITRGRVGKKWG